MTSIQSDSLKELFRSETACVWLPAVSFKLLTTYTLHLVANTEAVTVGGITYTPCPFEMTLPEDSEETVPQVTLLMDAVGPSGRSLIKVLQETHDPAKATINLLRGTPGISGWDWVVETSQDNWVAQSASVTAKTISLTLGYRMNLLNEPATVGRFVPSIAPGIFR